MADSQPSNDGSRRKSIEELSLPGTGAALIPSIDHNSAGHNLAELTREASDLKKPRRSSSEHRLFQILRSVEQKPDEKDESRPEEQKRIKELQLRMYAVQEGRLTLDQGWFGEFRTHASSSEVSTARFAALGNETDVLVSR